MGFQVPAWLYLGHLLLSRLLTSPPIKAAYSIPRRTIKIILFALSAAAMPPPNRGGSITNHHYKNHQSAENKYKPSKTLQHPYSQKSTKRHSVNTILSIAYTSIYFTRAPVSHHYQLIPSLKTPVSTAEAVSVIYILPKHTSWFCILHTAHPRRSFLLDSRREHAC